MDESSDKSAGERASPQPDDAQTPGKESVDESAAATGAAPQPQAAAGNADERRLPVVWSPKLDAGEDTAEEPQADAHEDISSSADEATKEEPAAAAAAALPRTLRFLLLAASVALAAALGSFVGSLSASGIAQLWPSAAAKPVMAEANAAQARKAELAELAALKANLEGASRGANSQFAKLADRLDRIERAELDPAAKIAHIADAVDRLEKRTTAAAASPAPETTASIASNPPPASEAKQPPDKVLRDWIVQDVRGSRALVENRFGGVFAVMAGSVLPGLGRVETIKRQDGEWIVVTERGIISSEP